MRRKISTLIALCLVMPLSLVFTACGHEHTFAEDWTMDATHHWHAATCEHTEEKGGYAEHDYTDDADTNCNTCGYVRETAGFNIWDGTTAEVPAADNDGVITILSAEQLAGLAKAVNDGTNNYDNVTIKLGVDIDLCNKEWTPIGYGYYKAPLQTGKVFKGNFDGQDHTIFNLKITGSIGGKDNQGSAGVGLFGQLSEAKISNLKIEGASVVGNHYVGAVVGFAYFSSMYNCDVNNANVSCILFNEEENGDKAGVVTGYLDDGNVTHCNVSNSTVSASRDAGQLIGCEANNLASNGVEDITTGNSATNVVVSWNNTGTGKNIKNEFVGRPH